MTSEPIPAATILLLRDQPDLQVLMIERHADINFAGGALVFPGGRIGEGDYDPAWLEIVQGDFPEEQTAPRIAAIREAYEETGILLARRQKDGPLIGDADIVQLAEWRQVVEEDDRLFLDLIRRENLYLACDALTLFARWLPPAEVRHRRYFTWFFGARTPAGQIAREDGNEATDAVWLTPQTAIDDHVAGARRMIFPTMRNIELLGVSKTAQSVLDFAMNRKIDTIQPALVERDNIKYISIPKDMGYPITEEKQDKAVRR